MVYPSWIICNFAFLLTLVNETRATGHVSSAASVVEVHVRGLVDLVLLDTGLDGGVRQGMVCLINRESSRVAEVLIVDSRSRYSAALIVNLSTGRTIQVGDSAIFKVLKTNSSTNKRVGRPSRFATIADSVRNT